MCPARRFLQTEKPRKLTVFSPFLYFFLGFIFVSYLVGLVPSRLPFTLYHKRGPGGSWEGCGRDNVRCQGGLTVRQVREVAAEGVASGKQRDLVDFSEHFCDVAKDWRNEKVVIA